MKSDVTPSERQNFEKTELGFWLYLMTDIILFASLFAVFMVLRPNTAGGPTGLELFDQKYALVQTILLLMSSLTAGLALLSYRFAHLKRAIGSLILTILLGAVFLWMELYEFSALIAEGNSWQRSGFLSSFFVLVGAHGLHILIGIVWATMMVAYLLKSGLSLHGLRKLTLFTLFWHFLDLVWIFLFTIVYLIGGLA